MSITQDQVNEAKENISTTAKEILATGDLSKVVTYLLALIFQGLDAIQELQIKVETLESEMKK